MRSNKNILYFYLRNTISWVSDIEQKTTLIKTEYLNFVTNSNNIATSTHIDYVESSVSNA